MLLKILYSSAYTLSAKVGLLTIKFIMQRFDKGSKLADKLMDPANKTLHQTLIKSIKRKKGLNVSVLRPFFKE
jgi:hypothetical protein